MVGGWSKVIGISLVICHPGTMENFNIENSDNSLLHIELCAWRRYKYFLDDNNIFSEKYYSIPHQHCPFYASCTPR